MSSNSKIRQTLDNKDVSVDRIWQALVLISAHKQNISKNTFTSIESNLDKILVYLIHRIWDFISSEQILFYGRVIEKQTSELRKYPGAWISASPLECSEVRIFSQERGSNSVDELRCSLLRQTPVLQSC